jgi:uncharacterized protein YdiU (UPF0061 family)
MSSTDKYQQYSFSQELVIVDKDVDALQKQLDLVTDEFKKLVHMGQKLKQHQTLYKNTWKQNNMETFVEVMKKSKQLENLMNSDF